MREFRSASQILFGHLPDQTIDADGGIWKVKRWNDPKLLSAIDPSALRDELIRAAYVWKERGEDGGFIDDLYSQRGIKVLSLNKEEGIWCEPFPRLYLCQKCKRLHDDAFKKCECGSSKKRGQLPFVGYHDICGAIRTPYVKKCPVHNQKAVKLPGTASAAELVFYCPICEAILQKGFAANCDCGTGTLSFTVHRSGMVFKPHGISMINPPRREVLITIEQAGGGERALEWLLDGMRAKRMTESAATNNPESLKKLLESRGFDSATIETMIAALPPTSDGDSKQLELDHQLKSDAERQAKQIALATFESRITLSDLLNQSANENLKTLYSEIYKTAMSRSGIERVELIDRFPVLTAQYGYTRGASRPGESRLRTYRDPSGEYTVYGELDQTEALLFRLDPSKVYQWLVKTGETLPKASDSRTSAEAILSSMSHTDKPNQISRKVTELVHSLSHALIKKAAVYAGIDRSALSELILPTALSFFVYAAARGNFVLGGLQALFESELHLLLDQLVEDEYRCALDPGCEDTGASCAVCLHLGEPSCHMFNTLLSRHVLAGGLGYFDITVDHEPN